MEKFLGIVFTAILVFWLLKWLFVLIGPWLLKLFAKRMMKKAGFDTSAGFGSNTQAEKDDDSRADTLKSDKWWKPDEVILKPSRHNGQSISDILGGEYIDCTEVE